MAFIEKTPLVLPRMIDKPLQLGDLWDCKKSDKVSSCFPCEEDIPVEHLDAFPIQTLDYNLKYIKDTETKTMTMKVGLYATMKTFFGLEVTIGSANITKTHQASFDKEQLQIHYNKETFVVRLLPSAMETVQEDLRRKKLNGELNGATHIVTEITYGFQLLADLLVETTSSSKITNQTSSGLGSLIIGPLSAGVEAGLGAVFKSPPDNVTITMDIEAYPEIPNNVANIEEMLKAIKDFDKEDNQLVPVHFPEIPQRKITGEPIRLFLVPISQFLPEEDEPAEDDMSALLSEMLLESFHKMWCVLTDFKLEGYYRKRVTRKDYRLRQMMEDKINPLTRKIVEEEDKKIRLAETLYERACAIYTNGMNDEAEVESLLAEYKSQFKIKQVDIDIDNFAKCGKMQLALIQADDIDDSVQAEFATSEESLENLKQKQDPSKPYVILHTKQEDNDEEPPLGVFLAAYTLSKGMPVLVVMPNVSTTFSLDVFVNSTSYRFEGVSILLALDFLSVASSVVGGCTARFYQLLTSLKNHALPASPEKFASIIPIMNDIVTEWKNVIIFETIISLRAHLVDPVFKDTWMICVPIMSPLSSTEAIMAVKQLRADFNSLGSKVEWLVGDFEIKIKDAPLLTVFHAGQLQAVCLDDLDILLLKDAFQSSPSNPDFRNLKQNSNFRSVRTMYAYELQALFNISLNQPPKPYSTSGKIELRMKEEDDNSALDDALEICEAYLASVVDRELVLINSICRMMTKKYPNIDPFLSTSGWSAYQGKFTSENFYTDKIARDAFRTMIFNILFNVNQKLTQIGSLLYTIEYCIEIAEKSIEEPEESVSSRTEENPFQELYDLMTVPEIITIIDSIEGLQQLLEQVPSDLAERITLCQDAVNLIREKYLLSEQLSKECDCIYYIQTLLQLLPELPAEEEIPVPETLEQDVNDDQFIKIVEKFVLNIDWSADKKETLIDDYLNQRLVPKILQELSEIRFQSWFNKVYKTFQTLEDTRDSLGLIQVLLTMTDLSLDPDQKEFIWRNHIFLTLIRELLKLNEENFIRELTIHTCPDEVIPPYVPVDIAKILRQALKGQEINPSWIPHWESIDDALIALQTVVALEVMPTDFTQVLRRNLARNSEIREQFSKSDVLFYWNEGNRRFDEPWDLSTVRMAVEGIRSWRLQQMEHSTPLVQFEIHPIETTRQVADLIEFVRKEFPATVQNKISKLQMRRRTTPVDWNNLWTNDALYRDTLTMFFQIVTSPQFKLLGRSLSLSTLNNQFSTLSEEESRHFIQQAYRLNSQLEEILTATNADGETKKVTELRNRIQQIRNQVKKRLLQVQHFTREFLAINELYMRHGVSNSNVLKDILPSYVADFISGGSVEIFDRFRESVNVSLLKEISATDGIGDLNIFVVSTVGDIFKSKLLQQLFPQPHEGTKPNLSLQIGSHGTCSLWMLPPEMKQQMESNVDAFLLVDMDDLFIPGNTQKDKAITALSLATSDLTLAYSNTSNIRHEFLEILGISLIESGRFEAKVNPLPDVIFIHPEIGNAEDVKKHIERLHETILPLESNLGLQRRDLLSKIAKRSQNDLITQTVAQVPGVFTPGFSSENVESLFQTIVSACEEQPMPPRTLRNWVSDVINIWNVKTSGTSSFIDFSNVDDVVEFVKDISPGFDRVRERLEIAMLKHAQECDSFLINAATNFKPLGIDKEQTLQSLLTSEDFKTEVLNKLLSHLTSIPDNCKPINEEEQETKCTACQNAAAERDTFLAKYSTIVYSEIPKAYTNELVQVQWSRLHEKFLCLDIQACGGITTEFENVFEEFKELAGNANIDNVVQIMLKELRGKYSDKITKLSLHRLMQRDVSRDYSYLANIVQQFSKDSTSTNLNVNELTHGLELKLMLQDVSASTSVEYDEVLSSLYQIGMSRKIKTKVQTVLNDYESKYEEIIDCDTKWEAHLYTLRVHFNSIAKGMRTTDGVTDSMISSLKVLERFEDPIRKEIKTRLERAENPNGYKKHVLKYIFRSKPKFPSLGKVVHLPSPCYKQNIS